MGDSRRRWSPEFKRDAVALVRSSGRPISDIARELGCGESSLGYWLTKDRQSRAAADPERFAAEQAESAEIKRLRRRVAELEVEREILKRSAAWWVKEACREQVRVHRCPSGPVHGGRSVPGRRGVDVRFSDWQARQAVGPSDAERLEADLVAEIRVIHARSRSAYRCPRVVGALHQQGRQVITRVSSG